MYLLLFSPKRHTKYYDRHTVDQIKTYPPVDSFFFSFSLVLCCVSSCNVSNERTERVKKHTLSDVNLRYVCVFCLWTLFDFFVSICKIWFDCHFIRCLHITMLTSLFSCSSLLFSSSSSPLMSLYLN